MAENLVAVFTVGMLTRAKSNLLNAKQDIVGMRTLIFTDKRLLVAELVPEGSIDPSIKKHTKEYEEEFIKLAKERAESLTGGSEIDALLQSPNTFSVDYDSITNIKAGALLAPQLSIRQNDGTTLQFIAIDRLGFKGSLHALQQAVPDMVG